MRRVALTVAGTVVVLAGLILSIPGIPGPGVAVVLGGLAILAAEYHWARRLLAWLRARAEAAAARIRKKAS